MNKQENDEILTKFHRLKIHILFLVNLFRALIFSKGQSLSMFHNHRGFLNHVEMLQSGDVVKRCDEEYLSRGQAGKGLIA